MKRTLISLLALLLALPLSFAIPAYPTPIKYTQPDGSVIILQKHGDEFFHWTTDALGRIVEKGADGFYRPSGLSMEALAARAAQAEQQRAMNRAWSSYENPPETNFGDRKVLCIIANFTDSTFVIDNPNQHFTNMLNQPDYSEYGAIGSVRDYYIDNSLNLYRPKFDVYGPVNLSHSSAYYDENGAHLAIMEAYELMKDQINIADYDTDNNGTIDMVLFYYPGHNEAEGGGEESIWPHQSTAYFGTMGGKSFNRYFCTSELRGYIGAEPASIGTTCHEFAHSLGLPDFYDTDYGNSGGQNSYTTGIYDVMSSGSYNDNGRRPPYLNALERNMLGWMDYPEPITSSGNFTLQAVQKNKAYQFESSTPGEYFILESRNGNKWDTAIPSGLLIYHVDKSDRVINGGYTAAMLWGGNKINAYYGHPCFRLIPNTNPPSNWSSFVFPGMNDITSFIPTEWSGNQAPLILSSIAHNGSMSTFTATLTSGRTVYGTVTDTDGNPLAGVEVILTPSVAPFNASPSLLATSRTLTTDASGSFSFELGDGDPDYQILSARKDGYTPSSVNLTLSSLYTRYNIVLLHQGEAEPTGLSKYDTSLSLYDWTLGTGSFAAGVKYTAEELEAAHAVGGLLKSVSFMSSADKQSVSGAYIVVDIEGILSFRRDITSQYEAGKLNTIDISDAGIVIPAGESINIGYGFTDIPSGQYPFSAFCYSDIDRNAFYTCSDFLNRSYWSKVTFGEGQYGELLLSAVVSKTADVDFSTLGISYINVDGGTPKVVVAAGKSLRSTAWYLDGIAVETPPAVSSLATGAHTYMVRLTYYDGSSERVYYDVDIL